MRRTVIVLALLVAALAGAGPARAASGATLPQEVAARYRTVVIAHDAAGAARLRTETRLLALAHPSPALERLRRVLGATRDELHPWPLSATVAAAAARVRLSASVVPERPYDAIREATARTASLEGAGRHAAAAAEALRAYGLSAGLRGRLGAASGGLDGAFWSPSARDPGLLVALDRRDGLQGAADRVRSELAVTEQTLGDVRVSRATVITDAAVLVFREGLEAVLILAAITASFVGAKRHLRRPVLVGGLLGLLATAITWGLVQLLVRELGTGGLRLEAITGILAIAVLLVVTNWFFHRVYWSQWIARFNRRRKALERLDRLGFVSGQVAGLALLGLTSVYREGFETVLFLQNLQASAGTGACLTGAGIGLALTLAVGVVTFVLQRKLPYRRMLVATGMLIAVVLAVMTGTTVHVLQGLGWLPSTPTSFELPIWANSWLGLYATWQGLAGQVLAVAFVVGSYVVARELQVRAPQRRAARRGARLPVRA